MKKKCRGEGRNEEEKREKQGRKREKGKHEEKYKMIFIGIWNKRGEEKRGGER